VDIDKEENYWKKEENTCTTVGVLSNGLIKLIKIEPMMMLVWTPTMVTKDINESDHSKLSFFFNLIYPINQ